MSFYLKFQTEEFPFSIDHSDEIILLGSCFSDSMEKFFVQHGFNVLSNPFGTIFHPVAIMNNIDSALKDDLNVDVLDRDGLFFSWDSSSKLFSNNKNGLVSTILDSRRSLKSSLSSAKLLVITLGTAYGYQHLDLDYIVGNCHRAPNTTFEKQLSTSDDLINGWKKALKRIKELNPDLKVVFTVSPVRHVKDGLVENNRSKARLLETCHQLCLENDAYYFPSYEIVIDVLRDYRFYKEDRVHPNMEAIQYVWKNFASAVFSTETQELAQKVSALKNEANHKSLFPGSKADATRVSTLKNKMDEMMKIYPQVNWE